MNELTIKSLGEISEKIDYGFTASAASEPIGPRFLRITDIQHDNVDWTEVPYCPCPDEEFERFQLRNGDIVFARTGATTGKSYLIRNLKDRSVFASYLIRVRPSRIIDSRYLSHFFKSPHYWNQINVEKVGAAQPGVNASRLSTLKVPVPSLSEQNRVAGILDHAQDIQRKRETSKVLTNDLLRSIFIDMFGDPSGNRKKWPMTKIRELVSDVKYGTSEKSSAEGHFAVLRMNNITFTGMWDFSELKYMNLPEKDQSKYLVRKGDMLFNRTNSKELVGKTAVYRNETPMAFAGYLIRVRFNEKATAEYVSAFMNSAHGKFLLRNMCKNIIGMANINAQELQEIAIPQPPIDLQKKYSEMVACILKQIDVFENAYQEATRLYSSLVQSVFRIER